MTNSYSDVHSFPIIRGKLPQMETTNYKHHDGKYGYRVFNMAKWYPKNISKLENHYLEKPVMDIGYKTDLGAASGFLDLNRYLKFYKGYYTTFSTNCILNIKEEVDLSKTTIRYRFSPETIRQVIAPYAPSMMKLAENVKIILDNHPNVNIIIQLDPILIYKGWVNHFRHMIIDLHDYFRNDYDRLFYSAHFFRMPSDIFKERIKSKILTGKKLFKYRKELVVQDNFIQYKPEMISKIYSNQVRDLIYEVTTQDVVFFDEI